jgi:uncharacterized membrane protein
LLRPTGMDAASQRERSDGRVEGLVTVRRPVDEVFAFYRDFENLPRFMGDVMAIERTGPTTSRWTIAGPFGLRLHWTVEVTEEHPNESICYRTVARHPARTYWEIAFTPGPRAGETQVREVMRLPGGGILLAALALIGKFPAAEVTSNLHRFKELMETGRVTDMTHSVRGKFSEA